MVNATTLASSLPPSQRIYAQPGGTIAAYFVLQFFGFASLSVLLLTFVSGRVKRDKTIWSLLAVFMFAAWASSLVFISGTLFPGSTGSNETPYGLCLANASFIVGGTTSMSMAALNIVLNILLKIVAAKGRLNKLAESKVLAIWFLVSPWLCWLSFFVASVVVGNGDPEKVYKAVFYCSIDNDLLINASTILNAIVEVLNIIVQIAIGVILFQHHRSLKALLVKSTPAGESIITASQLQSTTPSRSSSTTLGGVSLALVFRLGLFQACVVAALCVSIGTIDDFTSLLGDFSITAIGPLVFFIFASQADVLRAWHILPAQSPASTLPFNLSQSQSNPNPRRLSSSDDHTTPQPHSSSSSAYDFHLSSTNPQPTSSSSRAPKLAMKFDPANSHQAFALDTLRFNQTKRRDDDGEETEDSEGGKLSVTRTVTRSSVGESSFDDTEVGGGGGGRGADESGVGWGSQVALRKNKG